VVEKQPRLGIPSDCSGVALAVVLWRSVFDKREIGDPYSATGGVRAQGSEAALWPMPEGVGPAGTPEVNVSTASVGDKEIIMIEFDKAHQKG
jgi:hypothetical protein